MNEFIDKLKKEEAGRPIIELIFLAALVFVCGVIIVTASAADVLFSSLVGRKLSDISPYFDPQGDPVSPMS